MFIPGADAIYLGQTYKFLLPVRIGNIITAIGEVVKIVPEKRIAYIDTIIVNKKEEVVVEEEASVMVTKPRGK